jgi:hypothetical protein
MTARRAWSFLTIEGVRQYGGNAGYNDDPASAYRYDSSVPSHLQVRPGDIVIIRSRSATIGLAEIGPEGKRRKGEAALPALWSGQYQEARYDASAVDVQGRTRI